MIYTRSIKNIEVLTNNYRSTNAVLFIHGNSLNATLFEEQINNIHDILIISISLPGHGNSLHPEKIENIYSLSGYVKCIVDVIDELQIDNLILAGHSLGGHVAIECLGLSPKIKGLLIFGTPPVSTAPDMAAMYHPNPNLAFLFQEQIEESVLTSLSNDMVSTNQNLSKRIESMILKSDPRVRSNLANSIGAGNFKNEIELIHNATLPIAILHGEEDRFVNSNYLQQIDKSKLWEGKIHFIKNAGHCPQLESVETFNHLLRRFYSIVFSADEKK